MTAARPDTWMPIYWGDYARDTGHLSATMHGAYLMLIKHYWSTGEALVDDDAQLWRVACCDSVGAWRKIRPTVEKFFRLDGGRWHHGRIDKELSRAVEITNKRSLAGIASAKQRANKCSTHVEDVLPECTQQTGIPSQSQSHKEISKEEIKDSVDQILKAIGGKRPHSTPQANWDDPANRKARWQQKMQAELFNRLPKANAEAIWTGYVAGDPKAIAFIETVDKSVKQRRASVQ